MIHGIGTDIVTIARMREALGRHGERFAERVLAPAELADYARARDGARFLAKRFAAKEAFAKALGTGLRPPATLAAIGITHDELGKPLYLYDEALAAHLAARGLRAHLSISDEQQHVVAFAILETQP
ncbi:MAG: holo-ACP synthase [Candidatus Dactylopiibacterium carminicum]|uniref:Holo-[acyl-carrier-protein] synthase n=1 Tax=Candidatus Dactylopiibacterium carminicum TaxID=857335 RepID=A0A272EVZ2_9RHOO|nr:holo-ACP synthase [Candidatus Dactylopiibacterium carminicum]KAF7599530.1 holo-ACP synthase [Candidatus Dactylopiibacterium carminicum]PAS94275.1 MAG: holo-ACP synthase [Candidatus Dactylopiibacterium carminicum]PAS98471.1 MAG: holo-ACP synthase [Candidatus Dactylopiibacterium carminicum]PAS99536.1 MAG: holo-ACP synthase [Candidatus Dactylopiibacterium carminicum]